jgi:ABC-2 type transport system permease protein
MFQGIQAVACRWCRSSATRRRSRTRPAPLPIELVAVEKIVAGAIQCLIAAAIVFPIAKFVPATPVHLQLDWPVLLTVAPIACTMSAALGLMFGTLFDPRTVPLLFGTS